MACSDEEKQKTARLARKVFFRKLKDDVNIEAELDEQHEKVIVVTLLNQMVPDYFQRKGLSCTWSPVQESELDAVDTVKDFENLCAAHIS